MCSFRNTLAHSSSNFTGSLPLENLDFKKMYFDLIPGHFLNSEHTPCLFPMFNFKKHRSMHCELLCNQLYRTPEILK
jgi:hypothetical protein